MDIMIRGINSDLQAIIDSLAEGKETAAAILAEVDSKIIEKTEEGKLYKSEIENNKQDIKALEAEIRDLEKDLDDLNTRFGQKDLDAMLEAGNREINAKMTEKHTQITKHRQKIGELTEKGRSIRELLTSLKKDKATKEKKLEEATTVFNYYNNSISKLTEYAEENPNSLEAFGASEEDFTSTDDLAEESDMIFEEITPAVTDEITFDEENQETAADLILEETETEEVAEEELVEEPTEEVVEESTEEEEETVLPIEPIIEESVLPAFDAIVPEVNNDFFEPIIPENTLVEEPIQEVNEQPENPELNEGLDNFIVATEEANDELSKFLTDNNFDATKFNDLETTRLNFDLANAKKVLNVLRDNQIELEHIYDSSAIFNANSEELSKVITKLLLADQRTSNISLVLGALSLVDANKLGEVITNYGADIKDANITDIVLKASGTPITVDLSYINDLGYTQEEISGMTSTLPLATLEGLTIFKSITKTNYNNLNKFNINNIKEVFSGYAHTFLINPSRFDAILDKYDPEDLVRCLEKNAAVIEKL